MKEDQRQRRLQVAFINQLYIFLNYIIQFFLIFLFKGLEVVMLSLPPIFKADHPFMFFIRETETNTIIFSGRIEKFQQ